MVLVRLITAALHTANRFGLLLTLGLGLSACATHPPTKDVSRGSASEPTVPASVDENYPFSEFEKIYDTVLETMAPRFFEGDPAADKEAAAGLMEFVRTTLPKAEFVARMTDGTAQPVFERARTDTEYRSSPAFQREFQVRVNVSVQMAMIMFAGRFDVYARKILRPDDLTRELFQIANNREDEDFIAWISEEAPAETVIKELNEKLEVEAGDRFFAFSSPGWYWEQLAGRQGYLQVRGGKIVAVHVTLLN